MSDPVDTQTIHTAAAPPPLPAAQWRAEPSNHDYPAAANYLSLLASDDVVNDIIDRLKKAPVQHFRANDILRAANLSLLAMSDARVKADLAKVVANQQLSPVLLVRGNLHSARHLTIADGYHRVCASYHLNEATDIAVKIVELKS